KQGMSVASAQERLCVPGPGCCPVTHPAAPPPPPSRLPLPEQQPQHPPAEPADGGGGWVGVE
ncbi:Mediator of RNA polymerase II transcription subunit 13, partial [Dissostichus eleginoides]